MRWIYWKRNGGTTPRLCLPSSSRQGSRVGIKWSASSFGAAKFNVNSAARRKLGLAGFGGALRDHFGKILMLFSRSLSIMDSNEPELKAIVMALQIYACSRWRNLFSLIVELNSRTVISWWFNHTNRPRKFWVDLYKTIDAICLKLNCVAFDNVFREANNLVDALVKGDTGRNSLLQVC
ncbi:hypothetical protein PVK06_021184 [Gossypium arboreum]|uniref:RNase H type-1 domain-containing protein n=1 Tax=Gossypium arboreum TaxID=29729 RepID=A0ABR0PPA3_GOSAR|nr:hypothetical protein PVK06_021184 [Gossypium arboreum]